MQRARRAHRRKRKAQRQVLFSHETAPTSDEEGAERVRRALREMKAENKPVTFLSLGVRAGFLKVVTKK